MLACNTYHNSQLSIFNFQQTLHSQFSTFNYFFAFKSKKIEFRFVNSKIIYTFALTK